MSPVVLLNTFINHVFLSAVDQSNNIADIMGESKGEDEKEAESEEVRIKSSYRQPGMDLPCPALYYSRIQLVSSMPSNA